MRASGRRQRDALSSFPRCSRRTRRRRGVVGASRVRPQHLLAGGSEALLARSRTLLRAPLPGRYTPVSVHPGLPVGGFLFFWRIPLTVSAEGPSPATGHHQRLQVIFLREALPHRTVVADVVVHLLAND